MSRTVLPVSNAYRDAIHLTLVQQIPMAVLCLLMLDGGGLAKRYGVAMLAFWFMTLIFMTLICMARRPIQPTRMDIAFVRWGFAPMFGLVWISAAICF